MKAIIVVSAGQFGHDWNLVVDFKDGQTKVFYLGQDVKFCYRVLCCQPSYVVQEIGGNDLTKDSLRKKLAKFIIKELELDARKLRKINTWDLACQ